MLTTRELPPDEWPRLAGTELEAVCTRLQPSARVLVVEEDGRIVGCWSVLPMLHVDGLWIHPVHRSRGGVFRRLLTGMRGFVADAGCRAAWTAALQPDIVDLITRWGGQELPGRHFLLPLVK